MKVNMFVIPWLVGSLHFKQFPRLTRIMSSYKTHLSNQLDFSKGSVSETIYSLSSGAVMKAGVAVIRISGPQAKYCIEKLTTNNNNQSFPKPRMASLRWIRCPQTGDALDKGLVLWFPGPKSFTGEDCAELHIHSGRAVITGVLDALSKLDNVENDIHIRPAERGEFTQRAFYNNKMDLTEVEGLADLLAADTSEQRKQALNQMDGQLKRQYELWREELIKYLAHTEAVIDFSDDDREDDVNESIMYTIAPKVRELRDQLVSHLKDGRKGEILREGIQIALVGPPNAGKSSLLNFLAKRPASIVSPIAGTTRDIVEVRMDLQGTPCLIRDTAGLRQEAGTTDEIEKEGMRRAREAMKTAQIKIIVSDAADISSTKAAEEMLEELLTDSNKIPSSDIQELSSSTMQKDNTDEDSYDIESRAGVNELEKEIGLAALSLVSRDNENNSNLKKESAVITRARHRSHVKRCVGHLNQFIQSDLPLDIAAEELRLAMQELGRVTGRVDVEELLDVIFRDFCIGK